MDTMRYLNGFHLTNFTLFSPSAGVFPALSLVLASYAGCNIVLVLILFTVMQAPMGAYFSGLKLNPLDLSPNYAGSVNALSFSFGSLTGVAVPIFVGTMVPNVRQTKSFCCRIT